MILYIKTFYNLAFVIQKNQPCLRDVALHCDLDHILYDIDMKLYLSLLIILPYKTVVAWAPVTASDAR